MPSFTISGLSKRFVRCFEQSKQVKNNMILVLVAVEEELCQKDLPDLQIHYTGVGKINASIKTVEIIKDYSPTQIINYGTAGSLNKKLKGLVEVHQFFQRDMDASPLGLRIGQTPFDEIEEIKLENGGQHKGTGDSFRDTDTEIENGSRRYGGIRYRKNLLFERYKV